MFLNPSKVWLQPPGYVTQMLSRNYLPQLVKCEVTDTKGELDATAKRSEDGAALVLQVVNVGDQPIATTIQIAGFSAGNSVAQVTELSGPLDAVNTADNPNAIVPKQSAMELRDEGRQDQPHLPGAFVHDHSVAQRRTESVKATRTWASASVRLQKRSLALAAGRAGRITAPVQACRS